MEGDIIKPKGSEVGKFVKKKFSGSYCLVKFDGGLHKLGYAFYDVLGGLTHAYGRPDPALDTNNVAEMAAAKESVLAALAYPWPCQFDFLKIEGDSQVVINMINRVYTPRKAAFFEACEVIH